MLIKQVLQNIVERKEIFGMIPIEQYTEEKNKLLNFCRSHKRIYLYGAGCYGQRYLRILQHNGIPVLGFITTEAEKNENCGFPVWGVKDICISVTEQDGIIPAFLGVVLEEIRKYFIFEKPDILEFDNRIIGMMEQELQLFPYVEKLKRRFPLQGTPKNYGKWKNLLIIRLDVIGDVVCTTAFIRELKRNFPQASISMVIRKPNEPLLRNCPYIDHLFLYESEASDIGILQEVENFEAISEKVLNFMDACLDGIDFDAVFLPREVLCGRNKLEEFLMVFYSKAGFRFGRLIAFDWYKSWVYYMVRDAFTELFGQTEPMHETLFQLDMLKRLGLEVKDDRLELWINSKERETAQEIYKINNVKGEDELIAIGLVGSLPVKNWKIENYRNLIERFYQKPGSRYKFVLFGGKDAMDAADQLMEDAPEIIINLTGKLALDVTVACMECCKLYVGSNTGLLHIATGLDKPSVTLYMALQDTGDVYGSGPCRWGSRREDSIDLLPPAGLDGCYGVCRKKYAHCINQITPAQVAEAIESILEPS